MEIHRQHMQSASCVCSLLSLESTEHEFITSSANRSFMDATDAVRRPKRSWSLRTVDLTDHPSDNTKPMSTGITTNTSKKDCKLDPVIRTNDDTTIPVADASIQDISEKTSSSSSEDDLLVNNILMENNSAKDNTRQEVCLEADIVAVDNTSSQSTVISPVSNDIHLLESASASEVKETNSWKVSCAPTEASVQRSSFSYSSRLLLYSDAKISDCCDSVKPQSSSNYASRLILYKDAKLSACCDSFKPRSSSNYDVIPGFEIVNPYFNKFNKYRRKDRPQRAQRKWKKVPNEMQLNLRTSLFPRTGIVINISGIDDIEENEMQTEFKLFENALLSCEQKADVDGEINETCTAAISNVRELFADCADIETAETHQLCKQLDADSKENCVDFKSSIPVNVPVTENSAGHDANKILPELHSELCRLKQKRDLDVFQLSDCENTENFTFYENKISFRNCSTLESFSGLTNKKLRAKKKWKETKARIQIKTKYCRSLNNSVHGETFYMHHRVMKLMSMELKPRTYVFPLSLKRIDAARGFVKGTVGTSYVVRGNYNKPSPANHSAANTSQFAIDAFNADGDLAAEVVNIMINLQHRDLLPEDYELLLRLDDRVKPKTVDVSILTGLRTENVVGDCDAMDVCAVCLDPYEVGQVKKYLPCQHYFHETCIDNWLSNSSMNCPLDATPVLPS